MSAAATDPGTTGPSPEQRAQRAAGLRLALTLTDLAAEVARLRTESTETRTRRTSCASC
ncbi:hypothetical protein [Streptomyces flavofungini]|uniref:Uncharacterized protein n=1 Tax=Streptomyces flavofungini TaxID=68200 RepID=A0ABS0XCU6_9ACTN|nr:hypothetical protein [Streptomyces flavofungini]MBJ3810831.1 hypothetical protein [Streptomyces flavofungini]